MELTIHVPWLTRMRRMAIGLSIVLVLVALALPASAARPEGVSGEVTVVNDETDPVPVTVENEVAITGGNNTPVNVSGEVTVGNANPLAVEDAARSQVHTLGLSIPNGTSQTRSTFDVVSVVTITAVGGVVVEINTTHDDDGFTFNVEDETFSQVFPIPIGDVADIRVRCQIPSSTGCAVFVAVAGW